MNGPPEPASRAAIPVLIVVVLLFAVSGGLLWRLGYNYDGVTGGMVTKIHPATYLILATFAWVAASSGNPVAYAVRGAALRPGSLFLVVAMATMFLQIVAHKAPGMAGTIDTFLGPPLLVVLLIDLDERVMRRIEIAIHALMTANALMALAEFVLRTRFLPYRLDGDAFEWDTRSTALHGHPLANAIITAWYIMALLNGCRVLPQAARAPLIFLQFAALVTFGGRSATVVSVVLAGLYLAGGIHRTLRFGRVPILWAAAALVGAGLVPVVVGGLAASGFFDALLERFSSDGGSAHARVEMFAMFDDLPFRDLLVGPDVGLIESLRRVNGLEWGIENPIVKTILYQGILVTLLMSAAVTLFLVEIARLSARGVWLPMLSFAILINTSESIASKTTILSEFAVLVLCLYRPWPGRVARPMPVAPVRLRRVREGMAERAQPIR
jgi:hypothetical protein